MVDDFGVKYSNKQDALHLKEAFGDLYTITTNWGGNLYIGINLKLDYTRGTIQLSMPGNVKTVLGNN